MRATVAIAVAVLCAAVAHGIDMNYPDELTKAYSLLPDGARLGRFLLQVQVPQEPKEQTRQTLVFVIGAWGDSTPGVRSPILSGLALIWNAQNHWIASAGSVFCDPTAQGCDFHSTPGADLKVETGNVVMLNITDLKKNNAMGYEVSGPAKRTTTGIVTSGMLDQTKIMGVYTAASEYGVDRPDQFPAAKMMVLNIGYSAAADPKKDIPLKWETGRASDWGQEFVQQGDWLDFNWQ